MAKKGRNLFCFFNGSSRKRSLKESPTSDISFSREKQKLNPSNSQVFQPTLEEMKWVFSKFDSNGDGKISFEEYKSAERAIGGGKKMSDSDAAKSFGFIDSDGDGVVDFKEFVEVYTVSGGEVRVGDIERAFKAFDADGDRRISAEEVMEIMKRLGERSNLKACSQMVNAVDGDGDGDSTVDMKEFMKMMTSNSFQFQN